MSGAACSCNVAFALGAPFHAVTGSTAENTKHHNLEDVGICSPNQLWRNYQDGYSAQNRFQHAVQLSLRSGGLLFRGRLLRLKNSLAHPSWAASGSPSPQVHEKIAVASLKASEELAETGGKGPTDAPAYLGERNKLIQGLQVGARC
jgi:hypothetical protein